MSKLTNYTEQTNWSQTFVFNCLYNQESTNQLPIIQLSQKWRGELYDRISSLFLLHKDGSQYWESDLSVL